MTRERIGHIIESGIDEVAGHNLANLFGVVEGVRSRDAQIDEFFARLEEFETALLRRADALYGKMP
jgi:hypothetical protein